MRTIQFSISIFIALLFLCPASYGQPSKENDRVIDSLSQLVEKASSPSEKAERMITLGSYQFKIDRDLGAKTILAAVEIYDKKDELNRAKGLETLARRYRKYGDPKMASHYYILSAKAFKTMHKYDSLKAYYYMAGGRGFYEQAIYDTAMIYYMKSKSIYDKGQIFNQHHGHLHHYIGSVYKRQKDRNKAIYWYKKQAEYGRIHHFTNIEAEAVYLLADQSSTIEEQTALNEKALALFIQLNDELRIALVQGNLADNYITLERYNEAEDLLNLSVKQLENSEDKGFMSRNYCSLAKIHIHKKEYAKAQQKLDKAKEIADKLLSKRFIYLKTIHELYYKLALAREDYKTALTHYELFKNYFDSTVRAEYKDEVLELDVRYETAQKELRIAQQESEITTQNAVQEKELIMKRFLIAGLLATFLLGAFIFNRLKVTSRQKKIIEAQKSEVEIKNKEITDSMRYAKRIQAAILPPLKVIKKYLDDSFILYLPKDIVAGDFYWMEHSKDALLFAVADCTGHGVPGAMVSVVCNNGLNRSVREYALSEPGKILDQTRKIVLREFEKSEEDVQDGMDIALCALTGNTLKYAGANNPLWIIRHNASEIEEIKADKQPIGKATNPFAYNTTEVQLQKGDVIYLFSDGFSDQFGGENNKKYRASQLKEFLLSIINEDMQRQKELLEQEFNRWKGTEEQVDDICILGIRFN